uniref:Uncharacterized protein n=1 Tax=Podoviridae sp. ctARy1 TaxID=2825228 RepID=A0A8S5TSQ2_9CAUD|nr:MAG TPA: hypothetical protein [Podoviridae sp. ctARy1]
MNSVYDNEVAVAQNADRYNLDDLLKVIVVWNDPEEVRKDLQTIYFHATEALFGNDGATSLTDELHYAFITMRKLIEALATANDTKAAKLSVTII